MDPRTRSIIIGAVALFILVAVLGSIFLFGRFSKNQTDVPQQIGLDSLPQGNITITPGVGASINPQTGVGDIKTYVADGFIVKYPVTWGLLTCSNSSNFELDPSNSQDIKGAVCEYAVKPVTFLVVSQASCQGETVALGSQQVTKSKVVQNGTTSYKWCTTVGNKQLEISHRVSSSGSRATSATDYSAQIEQVIKDLQVSPAGS